MGKLDMLSHQQDYRDGLHDNENVVLLKPEFLTVWMMEKMIFEDEE